MWKLISTLKILSERSRTLTANTFSLGRRCLLSEAYQCQSSWKKRLNAPILQNLNLDEFYHALDQKFNRDGKASAIDIDLFANAVKEESYMDELEDLLYKLRQSCNTTKTLDSTHHAVIRYYLDIEQHESLIRILNDRLNYGVFPDDYSLCLILDTLITNKKISEAARVSSIHMLQEDWSNPLVSSLALYACHLYVQNPVPWQVEEEEEQPEEEIKVRVKFIRNPYFDDHFDLQDPQLLVGKTLAAIGATVPDAVGQTYQLIGLGLHRKWEKVISLLERLSHTNEKPCLFKSGIKICEETFEKELNDENDPEAKLRQTLKRLLKELDSRGFLTDDDLSAAVVSKVKEVVSKEEQNIIKTQLAVYEEWENLRERLLHEQIEELKKQQRIEAIAQEKERLIQREQELFFFDNEDNIDLLIQKRELEQEAHEDKAKQKKTKVDDENYIPPEIR